MNLADSVLPLALQLLAWLAFAAALAESIRGARWRALRDPARLNAWLGAIVALILLWSLPASVRPGLGLHLVGATLLVLMFGLRLALVALAVVLAAVTATGKAGVLSFGVNALLTAFVPAVVSFAVQRIVERRLPHNFFVYVFVAAFGGTVLATVATGLAITAVLAAFGPWPAGFLTSDLLPYLLLLGWGEALLTGMLVTVFVVYRPAWVTTFDDTLYLRRR